MSLILLAHRKKESKAVPEAYALYVEGELKATWDGEMKGFDKGYILSQCQRWCRPDDEIKEIEFKGQITPKAPSLPKPKAAKVEKADDDS